MKFPLPAEPGASPWDQSAVVFVSHSFVLRLIPEPLDDMEIQKPARSGYSNKNWSSGGIAAPGSPTPGRALCHRLPKAAPSFWQAARPSETTPCPLHVHSGRRRIVIVINAQEKYLEGLSGRAAKKRVVKSWSRQSIVFKVKQDTWILERQFRA